MKKVLHNAKETYIKEQIDTQQNNPRKFWIHINSISGLGKSCKRSGLTKIKPQYSRTNVQPSTTSTLVRLWQISLTITGLRINVVSNQIVALISLLSLKIKSRNDPKY